MAYSYVWPATLPQVVQKGYTETGGVLVLRTSMDAGPAKQRRRGARSKTMQVSFLMTSTQVDALQDFVENVLRGTARFGFNHPRTGLVAEVRIVPQQEGTLYNIQYIGPEYFTVSMSLEILP